MAQATQERFVPVSKIKPAPDNPRESLGDIDGLAESIKAQGVLEPLVVVQDNGGFTIVAGWRRFEAAKIAKLTEVPVVVREFNDQQRIEAMLVENLQREDLTPIEEARTFLKLTEEPFSLSQRDLAPRVGKSQSHISKRLALLRLPETVQKDVEKAKLSVQDAEQLARLDETDIGEAFKAVKADPYTEVRTVVDRTLANRKRQEKIEKAIADVEASGQVVFDGDDDWQYKRNSAVKEVGPESIQGLTSITPAEHAKLDCHVVGIDKNGGKHALCIEPSNHKQAADKAEPARKATPEEKAEEKFKAHEKLMREARAERVEFMVNLLTKRTPKAQTFSYLLSTLIDGSNANTAKVAVGLLDLGDMVEAAGEYATPLTVLREYAQESEEALGRAALAVALAANEDRAKSSWTPWPTDPAIGRHYAFLEQVGYATSLAEDKALSGKAPKNPRA